jgi:glycosyltransferase involved in cell wall biosynthesis
VPGVLYLVHGLPPEEYTGTPLVALGYAAGMARRGWRTGVVYASSAPHDVDGVPDDGVRRFPVAPVEPNGLLWSIERYGRHEPCPIFERILDEFRPDLLHVVDNVGLPLDWPEQAHARGIPVVRTVSCAEDLCGLIVPVSAASDPVGYCEAPITERRCVRCVHSAFADRWGDGAALDGRRGPLTDALVAERTARLDALLAAKRARAVHQFTDVFGLVLFSTPAWRAWFEQSLPVPAGRGRVLPMGMELQGWSPERRRRARGTGEPLVIAWATTLDAARGTLDVVSAFSDPALTGRSDYRLRIFGGGDASLLEPLLRANPNVEHTGRYAAPDLPAMLADCDVGLSASLFETFHRVTREYLLAGLPVIANPTFGASAVLEDGRNALLYRHDEPGSLVRAVQALLDDPALEARLAEGAASTPVRSVDEEVDELLGLYHEVLRSAPAPAG